MTASGTSVVIVAEQLSGGSVSFTGADLTVRTFAVEAFYAAPDHISTAKARLRDGTVIQTTTAATIEIYAHTIDILNLACTAANATSYGVALYPSTNGRVDGLVLDGTATYGINLSDTQSAISGSPWRNVRGVDVSNATLTDRRIIMGGRRGGSLARFEVQEGRFVAWGTGPFGTAGDENWYQQAVVGDLVYLLTPPAGGSIGYVCTTSGTSGTWVFKAFGTIAS